MDNTILVVIIAAAGFIFSVATSLAIVSFRAGKYEAKLIQLESAMTHTNSLIENKMATKDELVGMKESLAEIKGMFRLELKKDG